MTTSYISTDPNVHRCKLPNARYYPEGDLQHCEVCGRYWMNRGASAGMRRWSTISDRKARRIIRRVQRLRAKSQADFDRRRADADPQGDGRG